MHINAFQRDYVCVNTDTLSRLNNIRDRVSNLDLIFANCGIVNHIKYNQLDNTWGSGHFPLEIALKIKITSTYQKNLTNYAQNSRIGLSL